MSAGNIHAIIKEKESRLQKHKDQQHQEEISSKVYKPYSEDIKTMIKDLRLIIYQKVTGKQKMDLDRWDEKILV